MHTLAIDQGTSSTKALVIADDGAIRSCVEVPVHPFSSADGAVEQDPEELWRSIVDAGTEAIARAKVRVDGVGLANQGETVLAWDPSSSTPLTTAISWQDRRSASITERLRDREGELLHLTGLPLDPYFAAPKMAWLREEQSSEGVVTTTDAWLVHRLTGRMVTDAATASRTMLLDLAEVAWSPAAVRIFGLEAEELPDIVRNDEVVGGTEAFGRTLPLAGLIVDQQAALFADGCHEAGAAKCTYGTGAFLLANTGPAWARPTSGLSASLAWQLEGRSRWCLDGQVYTAGAAVGWLAELGLVPEIGALDALAGSAPPDHGVVFVPGLSGLAAPFWRPTARGAFLGLSLATSRASLVRSVLEGIAASVACLLDAVEADVGTRPERLTVDGGLTRSRWLVQAQSDLAQVPIDVYPTPHATAIGVAALTRLALGEHESALHLSTGWTPAETYEPSITRAEAADRLARWRAAVEATLAVAGVMP